MNYRTRGSETAERVPVVMVLSDPFHAVKAEVTQNAAAAEALAARWQELEGNKRASDERNRLRQQLSDILLSVTADLKDLEETINVVEKQRSRFRIDDEELTSRRGFIKSMKVLADSIYRSVDLSPPSASERSESVEGGGSRAANDGGSALPDDSPPGSVREDTERVGLLGGRGGAKGKGTNVKPTRNSAIEDAQQLQQIQIEQQDDLLDGLSSVVGRLKEQGHQINQEVRHQT